jgi:hypothetical protein
MTENSTSSSRTRHMDTRYFFVKEMQNDGLIKVDFVQSEENVSDIATKNVSGEIHESNLGKYMATKGSIVDAKPFGTGRVLASVPHGPVGIPGETGVPQESH